MITKIIVVYPGSPKLIFNKPDLNITRFCGMKRNGTRPHLIQVFGKDFDKKEKDLIYKTLRFANHPKHGRVMINGEFLRSAKI